MGEHALGQHTRAQSKTCDAHGSVLSFRTMSEKSSSASMASSYGGDTDSSVSLADSYEHDEAASPVSTERALLDGGGAKDPLRELCGLATNRMRAGERARERGQERAGKSGKGRRKGRGIGQ